MSCMLVVVVISLFMAQHRHKESMELNTELTKALDKNTEIRQKQLVQLERVEQDQKKLLNKLGIKD